MCASSLRDSSHKIKKHVFPGFQRHFEDKHETFISGFDRLKFMPLKLGSLKKSVTSLERAIAVAEKIVETPAVLFELNARSISGRKKSKDQRM